MAKILLVEDDNNLREIYEARLQAEGYDIVSAQDGEEALVKAKQEKPDLIISDVMMPRISGFEMLDILRNTEGLKHTKVIMLTALGQAEDQTRADSLGADRYLVKSQVTLEDIVKAAQELLSQQTAAPATPAAPAAAPTIPETSPAATEPTATSTPMPAGAPVTAPQEPTETPTTPAGPVVAPPTIPVTQPPAEVPATAKPTVNPALPPTPIAPAATTTTTPTPAAPPAPVSASVVEPVAPPTPVTTPQNSAPAGAVAQPAPQQPSAPSQPVSTSVATQAPTIPVVPAEPVQSNTPPVSTQQKEKKTEPVAQPTPAESATPATPAAPTANNTSQADDQLIADAMKNLTDSLKATDKPQEPTESEKLQTASEETAGQKETPVVPAPAPAPAASAPTVQPTSTVQPTTPTEPVAPTSVPEPAPEAPKEEKPAETESTKPLTPTMEAPAETTPGVEPDLDLENNVLPGVTDTADQTQPATKAVEAPAAPEATQAAQPTSEEKKTLADTASTADEQAVMKQQIDDFIKQQDARQAESTPTPTMGSTVTTANTPTEPVVAQPATVTAPESAIPTLSPSLEEATNAPAMPTLAPDQPTPQQPAEPATIKPDTSPAAIATPVAAETSEPESVSIAHKKVIQPPVEPMTNQPDLSELLAREGINNFEENPLPSGPVTNGGTFAQPPHQPGHVITPGAQTPPAPQQPANSLNTDDPNNIAL